MSVLVALLALTGCAKTVHVEQIGDLKVSTLRIHYNNSHLVEGPGGAFLIDGGLPSDAPDLAKAITAQGVDPKDLRAVIVTHAHADHAGGASWLNAQHGTQVYVGDGDQSRVSDGFDHGLCPTDATARGREAQDEGSSFTPFTPAAWVSGVTDLEPLTGVKGQIVSLPGHTPGSLVVVAGSAVFVGDLFRGTLLGNSAHTHFYMCDLADNRADVGRLLTEIAPKGERFFVGHFGPVGRRSVEQLR